MYILNVIKNIFAILDRRAKKQYAALQIFFFLSAFFQLAGIASIGPFITILSNQQIIHTNGVLSYLYTVGGFESDLQFVIAAAVGSMIMILLSNSVAGLTIWFTYKFSVSLGSKLQHNVYKSFLHRNYLFHKTQNYNHPISIVSQQIPRFVYMLLQPFLLLTSQLFVAIIILAGLLILDPLLAVCAGLLIGGSYLATYIYLRKSLARHGQAVSHRNSRIQSILSESFIGIKDIKLGTMEANYIDRFRIVNNKGLNAQASIILAGDLPKFVIETISFAAILLLAIVLLSTKPDPTSVIPILSIYALAGYKLLPTMQQVYKSISSLSGHGSVAGVIRAELSPDHEEDAPVRNEQPMRLHDIELKEVRFTYPGGAEPAVESISLKLERGSIYSIAGHSGSGKSTLADLLLGLLPIESGEIVVNGETLTTEKLSAFRNSLSYVAQSIFILDDTVVNNVAFGVPESEVDMDRVERALQLANADDFVRDLPEGIYSNLGQDGKLLSGGQRQRIGIARALYKQSDLLVLDEPTSALDMESEYKLLETLNAIKKELIILVISHRPASIKMSDKIILMEHGALEGVGSYRHLMQTNESFRAMIERSSVEKVPEL